MKTNIALIGMMGTYKTTCGKLLADNLDLLFLDTDALIEYDEGISINDIFTMLGEGYFREIESKKINLVSSYENIIISTGGGVVLKDENMENLKKSSYIVWLKATPEAIFSRVRKSKNRPLLKKMNIVTVEKLCAEREDLYRKYADVIVDTTNKSPVQIVDKLQKEIYSFVVNNIPNGG